MCWMIDENTQNNLFVVGHRTCTFYEAPRITFSAKNSKYSSVLLRKQSQHVVWPGGEQIHCELCELIHCTEVLIIKKVILLHVSVKKKSVLNHKKKCFNNALKNY